MVVMFVLHLLVLRMGYGRTSERVTVWSRTHIEPNFEMRCVGRSSHRTIDRLFLGLLSSGIDSFEFDPAAARAMPRTVDQLFSGLCLSVRPSKCGVIYDESQLRIVR